MAATRCFHWTVRLVIRTLFNCEDVAGQAVDSVAAREVPGIFGYVRAYLGVVEPQMRKALHVHMLVQLVGFSHPEDLFRSDSVANVFRRLWYYVASICFRSTEAFADYLCVPAAMQRVQQEPPLHLTKKQKGMIGEARALESFAAQLRSRGLESAAEDVAHPVQMSRITSTCHSSASCSAAQWSIAAVCSIAASTRQCGNHVCRPDVCYKGAVGLSLIHI